VSQHDGVGDSPTTHCRRCTFTQRLRGRRRLLSIKRMSVDIIILENVAIANALQVEAAPDATPVLFRFNYDVMPSLKSPILDPSILK